MFDRFQIQLVDLPGFEPGLTEPKSAVLPLHNRSVLIKKAVQIYKNLILHYNQV
jgi:hypothetical protein